MADPEAEHVRDLGNAVDAHALGHVVVVDVAAFHDRIVQVHVPVPAAFPAVEAAVAHLVVPRAPDGLAGADLAVLERRERGDHLVGGAGRVGALHRLVGQRAVLVLGQGAVVRPRDAAHEEVRVVGGRGGDGDEIAVLHVHHHHGRAFSLEPLLDEIREPVVAGELDVLARRALVTAQFAHHSAGGVDLDPAGAGLAAQLVLEARLDTELADRKARDLEQGIGVLDARLVEFAERADIAHDMGEIAPHRVMARQAHLGRDAGKRGGVDGDAAEILPAQTVGQRHRHEGAAPLHLAQRALELGLVDVDQLAQLGHHFVHVARILAHDHDPEILRVVGEHDATPVEDQPARRRDEPQVDAVLLGQKLVLLCLLDLQLAHPEAECADRRHLYAAQHEGAARDGAHAPFDVLGRILHSRRPRSSTSPGATCLSRSTKTVKPATSG